ncbi:MAG: transcriptional repressor [Candidatus Nomurabacteria bacterium]|jgi:Fur family peroxide stress response transcriptional regulator|nr:transcriptional repressor [Candidatus Nomurabacteria bacterium]
MRDTKQKLLIRQALDELYYDHPTATEVYELVRQANPRISLGTVYRVLGGMVSTGEIRKVAMPEGADRFDPQLHEHHHVSCQKCQKIFDIDIALAHRLSRRIERSTGVELEDLQLIGTGLCQKCKIKLSKGEKHARVKR